MDQVTPGNIYVSFSLIGRFYLEELQKFQKLQAMKSLPQHAWGIIIQLVARPGRSPHSGRFWYLRWFLRWLEQTQQTSTPSGTITWLDGKLFPTISTCTVYLGTIDRMVT